MAFGRHAHDVLIERAVAVGIVEGRDRIGAADGAARLVDRWKKDGVAAEGLIERDVAKISIVGSRLASTPGLAARMFSVLAREGINIDCISSSEMKVACVIGAEHVDRAVRAVHDEFFPPAEDVQASGT